MFNKEVFTMTNKNNTLKESIVSFWVVVTLPVMKNTVYPTATAANLSVCS